MHPDKKRCRQTALNFGFRATLECVLSKRLAVPDGYADHHFRSPSDRDGMPRKIPSRSEAHSVMAAMGSPLALIGPKLVVNGQDS